MTWDPRILHLEVIAEFAAHAQAVQDGADNYWMEHALAAREWNRQRMAELVRFRSAARLCLDCGEVAEPGCARCAVHLTRARGYSLNRVARRILAGQCARCGAASTEYRCVDCRARRRGADEPMKTSPISQMDLARRAIERSAIARHGVQWKVWDDERCLEAYEGEGGCK